MAIATRSRGATGWSRWRIIGWSIPALLLVVPVVAMRFTDEVDWTASDFLFAGVLFASVGLAFELIARRSGSLAYRIGAALALLAALLTVWVNAAVGMIGSEDNLFNLLFGGVLAIALVGALVARLEPAGMSRAMVAAAVAQAVASAAGLSSDVRGAIFSAAFAGLWLLAAAMFRRAARESPAKRA